MKHHIPLFLDPNYQRSIKSYCSNGRCATSRLFEFVGNIHDIEAYQGIQTNLDVTKYIFATHWGHLSVILIWLSGTFFHIAWTGNFSYWISNPVSTIAISHAIWDPHLNYTLGSVPAYSGVYNLVFSIGFRTDSQLYYIVLATELLALAFLLIGKLHLVNSSTLVEWLTTNRPIGNFNSKVVKSIKLPLRFYSTYMEATGLRLNFHIGVLIGFTSLLWSGHLVHVAIPASRGYSSFLAMSGALIKSLSNGSWAYFASNPDNANHIFGSTIGSGTSILTFIGGINQTTSSLLMSDIAHHHVAIGVLIIWASHLYSSLFKAIGHRISEILSVSGLRLSARFIVKSLHLQLSLSLLSLSVVTALVSHVMYASPSYPYLAYDYISSVSLFVHHNWISSFLIVGAFAHASLFLIRDYSGRPGLNLDIYSRLISHKASILSHLSWVSLFLGFHTLGVYVHNDVVVAFGAPYKQLLFEPVIAQSITGGISSAIKSYGYFNCFGLDITYSKSTLVSDLMASSLGPGDFLVAHGISLGLHVTSLILIKGALDSKGSQLMPDKAQFGYGFACDGPARGGTCDVSSWDSFYLALFWSLNSNSWLMFFFHWKHLLYWQGNQLKFDESSTFLNGWFRDYLWYNSASLIRGYDSTGSNDLSVWSWVFLAAHLAWATGFMFLISWRGYWQEIIDVISYMHLKTPFLYDLWSGNAYSPSALSILQARLVGLCHFSAGLILTYAAFVLGATT